LEVTDVPFLKQEHCGLQAPPCGCGDAISAVVPQVMVVFGTSRHSHFDLVVSRETNVVFTYMRSSCGGDHCVYEGRFAYFHKQLWQVVNVVINVDHGVERILRDLIVTYSD
jgi:hypothetical protein